MPIYEFACPKCRVIYSFLSKRVNPRRLPVCPKCGNRKLARQVSAFAALRGAKEATAGSEEATGGGPDFDDPKVMRAMAELERDMEHMDESNPKQMARLMRKMQDALPPGSMPKEMATAIQRLEAGEDPEKIEADMGDILGAAMGAGEGGGNAGSYRRDDTLHDY
jgi:putative FmdB family regulatory protein